LPVFYKKSVGILKESDEVRRAWMYETMLVC